MEIDQRESNPDVNTFDPESEPSEQPVTGQEDSRDNTDVERRRDDDVIPVPPDAEQPQPIEDPPHGIDSPVGDVDDSPKRIV